MDRRKLKLLAARTLSLTLVTPLLAAVQRRRWGGRFVRMLNYHGTPLRFAANFERHVRYYARHYCSVTAPELGGLLSEGRWVKDKPGLIISFDDGLRSNLDVAAPILEKYGFTGWFFIPTDFPDAPADQQRRFADEHAILYDAAGIGERDRIAMSWEELRRLAERHVVGCHTRTHYRLVADSRPERLDLEIIDAKRVIEERLGGNVDAFCWVGGEEHTYCAAAAQRIRAAGYRFAFATCSEPARAGTDPLRLHRTNVEADWPLDLVRFQLCGAADWANAAKRRRVDRVLIDGA